MKYNVAYTAKRIITAFLTTSPWALMSILIAALIWLAFYDWQYALILGGVLLLIPVLLVSFALLYWHMLRKAYGDQRGKVIWSYDIQKETITLSIEDKAKLTYEKEGVKSVNIYKKVATFRHKRGRFYLPFPTGREEEIRTYLKNNDWLERTTPVWMKVIMEMAYLAIIAIGVIIYLAFAG